MHLRPGPGAVNCADERERAGRQLRPAGDRPAGLLTDRCNLRCSYCMPAEGLDCFPTRPPSPTTKWCGWSGSGSSGSGSARSGSPAGAAIRRGLVDIVRRTTALTPRPETSLTTNALGLARTAQVLADAGLARVNVSLDTVRREQFREITRRDRLDDVVAGLEAAHAAGLGPVKVNAALLRGINDDQAPELLRWCIDRGYEAAVHRADAARRPARLARDTMVTAEEIFDWPRPYFRLEPAVEPLGAVRRPSCSPLTADQRRSVSSPRSPGRSAATVTGCG